MECPAEATHIFSKAVLHDWNDEASIPILQRCREAIGANGGLIRRVPPKTLLRVTSQPANSECRGSARGSETKSPALPGSPWLYTATHASRFVALGSDPMA